MTDVTQILHQIETGDPSAAEKLLPLVYEELRRLAAARMAGESPDHTLQATALVHEAYVRLVEPNRERCWNDRRHFFVAASEAMRRILIDAARRKSSAKRGGDQLRAEVDLATMAGVLPCEKLLALNEALDELSTRDPVKGEFVKLRFFGGLTVNEAADALKIPSRTAEREWAYARAWLQCQIAE